MYNNESDLGHPYIESASTPSDNKPTKSSCLYLYPECGHVEQSEEVPDELILLREEAAAHFRLAQAYEHGEQLEAVGVRFLLLRGGAGGGGLHTHVLGQGWLGGGGHLGAGCLPLLLHAHHLGVHRDDDVEAHLMHEARDEWWATHHMQQLTQTGHCNYEVANAQLNIHSQSHCQFENYP